MGILTVIGWVVFAVALILYFTAEEGSGQRFLAMILNAIAFGIFLSNIIYHWLG